MTDAITTLLADDPAPAPDDKNTPAPANDPAPQPDPAPPPAPSPEPKKDDPVPKADPAPVPKDDKAKPDDPKPKDEPKDWRQEATGGNEDYLKTISRYGSIQGVVKALHDTKMLISQGKYQRGKPEDESDEKAMKEWRKQEGIPDKPEDYKLPDVVTKSLTDADKPVLANFTEFAHSKGARPDVVSIASEWYVQQQAAAIEQQTVADNGHREDAEDALRLDWQGEYKGNMNLAKRFLSESPLGAEGWAGLRDKDGRMLGSNAEFLKWASDQGRERFGDSVFANPDTERSINARKEEIMGIMKSDRDRYFREKLDQEFMGILEKEQKRRK